MKKLLLLILLITMSVSAHAEFQLGANFGWFFEKDTYESDTSRSFNGLMLEIDIRYLFTENVGLFLGITSNSWFSGNNDDYVKTFNSAGMNASVDKDVGTKIGLSFGLALAYPVNEKFSLHSDIGMSVLLWGIESIEGTVKYGGYSRSMFISIDKMGGIGLAASLFGSYQLLGDSTGTGSFIFGLKMDFKFTRKEEGEVMVSGYSAKFSDTPKFFGLSFAPFIGYLYRR
jgi:hypothetical protein